MNNHRDELIKCLEALLEVHEEKCWLDHHGYCQEHYVESPCRVKEARDLLNKIEKEKKQKPFVFNSLF